ncbi:hypothetical protein [Tomitella gaofuii]|uniref:hypothetical protein n=1 Tax=Tomitella gaofuii TaxID=2760083 RepID=UPI0015FC14C8|nr:hypothetical protein [Tomitella gaofuii]
MTRPALGGIYRDAAELDHDAEARLNDLITELCGDTLDRDTVAAAVRRAARRV